MSDFREEVDARLAGVRSDTTLTIAAAEFMRASIVSKYSYNFSWQGRPIIQYPQDIVAMQELIWEVRPDIIIETGIAHGGSLILSASMLALIDLSDATQAGTAIQPAESSRRVIGIDIDIRPHNRAAIEAHPMSSRIQMIQGSSSDPEIIARVHAEVAPDSRVMVCLDSNHTHAHVMAELEAYAPLTSVGSYCVVFDTVIHDLPADTYPDRPWGPEDNPKTAVRAFLSAHDNFVVDTAVHDKLLITAAPGGYLKRIR